MPELPEVETVRRVLKDDILNLKISDIDIRYEKMLNLDKNEFKNKILNKEFVDIKRKGKFLIFVLNEGYLISHLRMEGKYFYLNDDYDNKHVHVIFNLSNGYKLIYQDVRKFGRMWYIDDDIYNKYPLNKVGVDLSITDDYDFNIIYDKIKKSKKEIKTTLLDQSIIAGLGNIYVDEVLFLAKINPHRLSNNISIDELNNILKETKEIFSKAIFYKGTTIRSYTSSLNVKGGFQDFLNVHTKEYCPICKNKLNIDKISGRSTYYCNNCER